MSHLNVVIEIPGEIVDWHSPAKVKPSGPNFSRLRILAVVGDTVMSGACFTDGDNFVADNGHATKLQDVAWWATMPTIPTAPPCYLCEDRPGTAKQDGFDICGKCKTEMAGNTIGVTGE